MTVPTPLQTPHPFPILPQTTTKHTKATMSTRKKFVIKQYKQPMTMDREAAQRTWHSLRDAIDQIHRQDASSLSFEELYR